MKTLLVMRHAKSDWDVDYGRDHERPLNRRGVNAAKEMGRLLGRVDLVPDLVMSSTALRAQTTAELAIEAGRWMSELRLEPGFYGTGVDTVLSIVAGVHDVGRLMIVGHQPTWGSLVAHLTGEVIEFKTATVAVIAAPVATWKDMTTVEGTLVAVLYPEGRTGE